MLTEMIVIPAWLLVFSTIFLMGCAAYGQYQTGYAQGKVDEEAKRGDKEPVWPATIHCRNHPSNDLISCIKCRECVSFNEGRSMCITAYDKGGKKHGSS